MSKLLDKNSQKNIVITGASSGIGKATAILMAREGHQVIATSRHIEKLNPLIEETSSIGCPIFPEELNINKNDEVDQCFARLFERFGSVDVLVNNAGYGLKGSIHSITSEQLQEQFNTNLFAAVSTMKAVLPSMIDKENGCIINITSILGRIATPYMGAYVSSKFALEGISESMRVELAPYGVRVCVVEPGLFKTNFGDNMVNATDGLDNDFEQIQNKNDRAWPYKAGNPERVAKTISHLVSKKNPKFRSTVGWDAYWASLAARFLPQKLFLSVVQKVMH